MEIDLNTAEGYSVPTPVDILCYLLSSTAPKTGLLDVLVPEGHWVTTTDTLSQGPTATLLVSKPNSSDPHFRPLHNRIFTTGCGECWMR